MLLLGFAPGMIFGMLIGHKFRDIDWSKEYDDPAWWDDDERDKPDFLKRQAD